MVFTRVSFLSGEPAPVATAYDEASLRQVLSETTHFSDDEADRVIELLEEGVAVNLNETVAGTDNFTLDTQGAESIDIVYPGALTIFKLGVG